MSDQLTEIAQTFLSLTPEGRAQFINTLAGSNPELSDWLAIFTQYHHENLERNGNE